MLLRYIDLHIGLGYGRTHIYALTRGLESLGMHRRNFLRLSLNINITHLVPEYMNTILLV
jgi:hypothetical protein